MTRKGVHVSDLETTTEAIEFMGETLVYIHKRSGWVTNLCAAPMQYAVYVKDGKVRAHCDVYDRAEDVFEASVTVDAETTDAAEAKMRATFARLRGVIGGGL